VTDKQRNVLAALMLFGLILAVVAALYPYWPIVVLALGFILVPGLVGVILEDDN